MLTKMLDWNVILIIILVSFSCILEICRERREGRRDGQKCLLYVINILMGFIFVALFVLKGMCIKGRIMFMVY